MATGRANKEKQSVVRGIAILEAQDGTIDRKCKYRSRMIMRNAHKEWVVSSKN